MATPASRIGIWRMSALPLGLGLSVKNSSIRGAEGCRKGLRRLGEWTCPGAGRRSLDAVRRCRGGGHARDDARRSRLDAAPHRLAAVARNAGPAALRVPAAAI